MINTWKCFSLIYYKEWIYAIGGISINNGNVKILSECEYYDIKKYEWKSISNLNMKWNKHKSFIYNDKIYVIGG